MKLLFKQRLFSWLDSYDIYDENEQTVYVVKGQLAIGHCLNIFDAAGAQLGTVRQKLLTWMPKYEIYEKEQYIGCISREAFSFRPRYDIDFNGWQIEGDFFEWDYTVKDSCGKQIAVVSKELFNFTDTYVIDVAEPVYALDALMFTLAVDAEKCSRN